MNKIPMLAAIGLAIVAVLVLAFGIKWGMAAQGTPAKTPTGPPPQAMKEMQNQSPVGRAALQGRQ